MKEIMYIIFMRKALISLVLVFVLNVLWLQLGGVENTEWLDIPFHFLGGFFVAMFMLDYLRDHLNRNRFRNFVVIVGAAMLVGVLWEFFEFGLSKYLAYSPGSDIFNIAGTFEGYLDTMGDLLMDILGAGIGFLVLSSSMRQKNNPG